MSEWRESSTKRIRFRDPATGKIYSTRLCWWSCKVADLLGWHGVTAWDSDRMREYLRA